MAITSDQFKKALDNSGIELEWMSGWKNTWHGMSAWRGKGGNPVALLLHHTAGASTESKDPNHKGNQCSADNGQVKFVHRHPEFNSPASQFTLRRCGKLAINAYKPCYHAGKGDFKGTQWSGLGIPKDSANTYLMGIEIVSKGLKDDLTDNQWKTLAKLAETLRKLYGWKDLSTYYFPRHKDYAPTRKVDIKASNKKVQEMFNKFGGTHWDGKIPDIEGILKAEEEGIANPASWRLACRLADLGYFKGTPAEKGIQKYPTKAMINYNTEKAPNMEDKSKYGPKAHDRIFGIKEPQDR
jgi:hypothetical protein